jgi:hypothetical protein
MGASRIAIVTAAALSLAYPEGRPVVTSPPETPEDRANVGLEVEAKATVERTDYRPMDPIWVRLDVKNETNHTWVVMSEDPYHSVSIEVEKDGEPVGATAYGEVLQSRRYMADGTEIVAPGRTLSSRRVLVNWVRDMTAPGEYSIKLSVPFFFEGEGDKVVDGIHIYSGGVASANVVTVRVSGRARPPEDR